MQKTKKSNVVLSPSSWEKMGLHIPLEVQIIEEYKQVISVRCES